MDLRGLLAGPETLMSVGSGMLAQPLSGLAGLLALPAGPERAANVVRNTQNALTYQPQTEQGQRLMGALGGLLQPVSNAWEGVRQATGDAGYSMGGPVGGMLGATLPDAAAMAIPAAMAARGAVHQPLGVPMPRQAGVVKIEQARSIDMPTNLPTSPEFQAAVANTQGAALTPEGLTMRVMRNQLPEQSNMPSVRGGVFYLPEGAQQAKYYSTGKNGYGGSERITGETLLKNPLFAKGGTGGKAPQAAYDALNGKGAYESMRGDALKSLGGYGASQAQKTDAVVGFLEKYAPDMVDYADYIVSTSGKGNQLPYALQEAAVAHSVRQAGHDAVLGYSKGKSGPFLSELFDVRETAYPDRFGTPAVLHDKFK